MRRILLSISILLVIAAGTAHTAGAAVTQLVPWSRLATNGAGTVFSATAPTMLPGSDRVMVIAIGVEFSAATLPSFSAVCNGQTFTSIVANASLTRANQMFYLKDSEALACSGQTIDVTLNGNPTGSQLFAAVYSNVDQTTPIVTGGSRAAGSGTAATSGTFGGTINVTAGGMVFYSLSLNLTAAGHTPPATYTEATEQVGTGFVQAIAYKPITTTGTENPTFTFTSAAWGVTAASLNPSTKTFAITTCTDCHGNPPGDGPRSALNKTVVGSHVKHVAQSMACSACHVAPGPTVYDHSDLRINMATGATGVGGGYYDKNGNSVFDPGFNPETGQNYDETFRMSATPVLGSCRNTACHGANSQIWGATGSGCTTCHTMPMASGAHARHYAAKGWTDTVFTNCSACHPDNSTTHSTFDGAVTVQVTGATIGGSGAARTCAGISTTGCHNGIAAASPAWNSTPGTIACLACHTAGGTNSATVANPVSGLHNITAAGVEHHDDGLSGGCEACHVKASISGHYNGTASATVDYTGAAVGVTATAQFTYTDAGGTGVSRGTCTAVTACHSDGNRWGRKWSTDANSTATAQGSAVCGVCHGDYTSGWNAGTVHLTAGTKGGPGNHHNGDCQMCHSYLFAGYAHHDTTPTHNITMNDTNAAYTRNGTTGFCAGCHTDTATYQFPQSAWSMDTVAGPTIPNATCMTCHGGFYPPATNAHAKHGTNLNNEGLTNANSGDNASNWNSTRHPICAVCHDMSTTGNHTDTAEHILPEAARAFDTGAAPAYQANFTCTNMNCHFGTSPAWK